MSKIKRAPASAATPAEAEDGSGLGTRASSETQYNTAFRETTRVNKDLRWQKTDIIISS
jgi:hypothetical protein